MPFSLRKSVSVGPFRFNLSKSGLGVSAGVRGFRIGSGPRGNYVHLGRGGLYYRKTLDPKKPTLPSDKLIELEEPAASLREVETGNLARLAESRSEEIVDEINATQAKIRYWPFLATLSSLAVWYLSDTEPLFEGFSRDRIIQTVSGVGVLLTTLAFWHDRIRRSVVLLYHLDEDGLTAFQNLVDEFDRLKSARMVWCEEASAETSDWKRHGGATSLVKRSNADLGYRTPSIVKCNVSVPAVLGGKHKLYFFPDVLLAQHGSKFAAVRYVDLEIVAGVTQFVEDEHVPKDAEILHYTWLHPNKSGGPDRRYSNNRQLPVARYQTLEFNSLTGVLKRLLVSKNESRQGLVEVVHKLADVAGRELSLDFEETPKSTDLSGDGVTERFPSDTRRFRLIRGRGKAIVLVATIAISIGALTVFLNDRIESLFEPIVASFVEGTTKIEKSAKMSDRNIDHELQASTPNKRGSLDVENKALVRETQQLLKAAGYDPGPIDGIAGPVTKNRIKQYQSDHGLQPTGIASSELLRHMRQAVQSTDFRTAQ